jgi:hypothetical protein
MIDKASYVDEEEKTEGRTKRKDPTTTDGGRARENETIVKGTSSTLFPFPSPPKENTQPT